MRCYLYYSYRTNTDNFVHTHVCPLHSECDKEEQLRIARLQCESEGYMLDEDSVYIDDYPVNMY